MITYEWNIITIDAGDDITEVIDEKSSLDDIEKYHRLDIKQQLDNLARGNEYQLIRLVKLTEAEKDSGWNSREEIYLDTENNLPREFDDGHKVPKRFHEQIERNKHWVDSHSFVSRDVVLSQVVNL